MSDLKKLAMKSSNDTNIVCQKPFCVTFNEMASSPLMEIPCIFDSLISLTVGFLLTEIKAEAFYRAINIKCFRAASHGKNNKDCSLVSGFPASLSNKRETGCVPCTTTRTTQMLLIR